MTLSRSRASTTDTQLSKHLTVFADLCGRLQPQSSSLCQYEWLQVVDDQLPAGCCFEGELLERLLKQNMYVVVVDDLETDETIFRRDEVSNLIEHLVDCLAAARPQAIASSSFVFNNFYVTDLFVVRGFASLSPESLCIPLSLAQLDCNAINLYEAKDY